MDSKFLGNKYIGQTISLSDSLLSFKIFPNTFRLKYEAAYIYLEHSKSLESEKLKVNINYLYHNSNGEIDEKCVIKVLNFYPHINLLKILLKEYSNFKSDDESLDSINFALSQILFINSNSYLENEKYLIELKKYNTDSNYEYANSLKELYIRDYLDRFCQFKKSEYYKNVANDDKLFLKMYNVGQANCSSLTLNDKIVAFFDLGFKRGLFKNKSLNFDFNNIADSGFVVISHFDDDHINLVKKLVNNKIMEWVWIIPEPPKVKKNKATQVIINNKSCRKEMIYNNSLNDNMYDCGYFLLNQGNLKKMSKYQSTYENAHCLVTIFDYDLRVLLPGDSLYEEFSVPFNDFDYMMVAHHGCNYDNKNIQINAKQCILCCSQPSNTKYSHPSYNHLLNLNSRIIRFIYKNEQPFIFKNNKKQNDYITNFDNNDFIKISLK